MWRNIKTAWLIVLASPAIGAHFPETSSGGQYDNEPIKGIDGLQLEDQEPIDQYQPPKLNSYGELFLPNDDNKDGIIKIIKVPVPQPLEVPIYRLVPQEIEKKVPIVVEKLVPIYVDKPVKIEIEKIRPVQVPKHYPVHVPIYKHVYVNGKETKPKKYLIKTVKSSNNW